MTRRKDKMLATEAVEDFIKAVYRLQEPNRRVSTNALAEALRISAPSVTDMAQRLSEAGLVDYVRYEGVRLTHDGETMALQILRRHRLIELYLVQELGYELHEVHMEAENLEHAVSERFIQAIADKLGHPEFDPHGDPIPDVHGAITRRRLQPLSEIPLHTSATVSRFTSDSADMLQHTLERGFKLNITVQVKARDPFDGPVTVIINDGEQVIGHNVAAHILVEVDEPFTDSAS